MSVVTNSCSFTPLQDNGIEPNAKTFSAILHACLETRSGELALAHFADARAIDGVVNAHLCAQAIQAHGHLPPASPAQGGRGDGSEALEEAIALYKQLNLDGIEMDGVALASLVTLAGDLGHHDAVLSILELIVASTPGPNARYPEPFAVAADLCAKTDNLAGAREVFELTQGLKIVPNQELGASLINAMSKNKDFAGCLAVFRYLLECRVVPNYQNYTGLLYACAVEAEPVLALELYAFAKRTKQWPANNSDVAGVWCTAILHAFLKTRRQKYKPAVEKESRNAGAKNGTRGDGFEASGGGGAGTEVADVMRLLQQASRGGRHAGASEASGASGAEVAGLRSDDEKAVVRAIHEVYRDAIRAGYRPTLPVLEMMLECVCTDLYIGLVYESSQDLTQARRPDANAHPASYSSPPSSFGGMGGVGGVGGGGGVGGAIEAGDIGEGAGLFETTAFSLFEEASALGVLPPCVTQSDIEIKIDFTQLTPVVSEVCLLVLLRSLKRRWDASEGSHAFKSLLLLLPASSPPPQEKERGTERGMERGRVRGTERGRGRGRARGRGRGRGSGVGRKCTPARLLRLTRGRWSIRR